jgi:HAE1 family hydrophobic/amphiphilic exporter-1
MAHRKTVMLVAVLVVFSTGWLFKHIGVDFLPQDDQSQMEVTLRLPEGTSLDATDATVREIADKMRGDLPTGVIDHILTTVGGDQQQRVNRASIFFEFIPMDKRRVTQSQLIEAARGWFTQQGKYKDYHPAVMPPAAISGGGNQNTDIIFVIRGPEIAKLKDYSARFVDILRATPGATDVDTSLEEGKPEVRVNINRDKASDLGVSVTSIATALRTMVGGQVISSYRSGDDRYDVRLRVDKSYRDSADAIARLYVPSIKAGNVRLDSVVALDSGIGPAQIDRYNRQRQAIITCNVARGHASSEIITALNTQLPTVAMESGYDAGFSGRSREMGRAAGAFLVAFLLSLTLMYMILAAQFESFIHPVTILLSLPLSVPFAIFSLMVTGQNFSIIYSSIGVPMLFGIVKKNSILQIDHTNNLRRLHGLPRYDAIMKACRDRMRPILMTTFALVAGMTPMAFGTGPGAGSRRSVAIMIIGGQMLCLLLTLLVTPVAYSLFDDAATSPRWARLGRAIRLPPVVLPPSGALPDFLVGGYGQSLSNLLRNDFRTARVGVSLGFPLKNRAAEGQLGRAVAEGRKINAQRKTLEQAIEVEVRNALQAVETTRQRVDTARASREAARKQLDSEQRRFQAGLSTTYFVLERQNALSEAQGRELRAMTDYNKALSELQRVMGTTLVMANVELKPATTAQK